MEYFGSKTGAEDNTTAAPFRGFGAVGVDSFVQKTKGDRVIWAIVILLTLASLLLVYSSTGSLAYRMSKSNESYLFQMEKEIFRLEKLVLNARKNLMMINSFRV